MIGMDAHEQRVILPEHGTEPGRNSLGQEDWDSRADPKKFHVRYRPQSFEQMVEFLIAEQQRITAAEKHIPHGRCFANIIDLLFEVRMKIVTTGVAHQSRTRAVSA